MFTSNFGSEFNDKYVVVFNGNDVKKSFFNKKPALRYAERSSLVKGRYVELWYQHVNGTCSLIKFWN